MKQNIIIVLLSAICGLLGYMTAKMQDRPDAVQVATLTTGSPGHANQVATSMAGRDGRGDAGGIVEEIAFDKNSYVNGGYRMPTTKPETKRKGIIKYSVYVNENGNADRVFINSSSGNTELDELVKQSAYQEKYGTKTIDGRPVKTFYKSSAEFK